MMDHARHLSSPSPTSPFLFHHSERPFKSNPLTPLLSSTVVADVSNGDDCFSTHTSPSILNQSHNPFGIDQHHHHHHHHHHSLVDSSHHHHHLHQQPQNHHQRHNNQCVIDQDSLTGVDDDDGMHNMLSGSSTSSNSTMPLLTESHSHHSFSRISLEEYSPLSLVEDCDNALTISPTSLACGSDHSFKTSLNGLKMDNLVGDVGVDVHDDDDDNHHHNHDDVNDARSMSPSLLSASSNNHQNLWSTSSTAITQNTSLLNSTSTSFLLSHHHHHHQLNSLIQQLEPQSLDEPPPLVSNSTSFSDTNSLTDINRPSSEPPSGCGVEVTGTENNSLNTQNFQSSRSTQLAGAKNNNNNKSAFEVSNVSTLPTTIRSRKNKNRTSTAKHQNGATGNKLIDQEKKQTLATNGSCFSVVNQQPIHSSKLHLQLNHHKKLQELQQRLFGTNTQVNNHDTIVNDVTSPKSIDANEDISVVNNLSSSTNVSNSSLTNVVKEEEPDSSAEHKGESKASGQVSLKTKIRPTRAKRNRSSKNEIYNPPSSTSHTSKSDGQKTVTTETAEPDTTTKSSDYIKLADLLSNNSDSKTNNSFIINGLASASETNDSDTGEKRLQQIQVQVSPSLTVVANGGLMQPIGIQQQGINGAVITSTGGTTFTNQILCRPQTVVATTGGGSSSQIKGIVSNNDLLKSGEAILSNWSLQANSSGLNNNQSINTHHSNTNVSTGQTSLGAHQIAIQVICQDGTSLVLPVSSAAGLNAAVSLTTQHQQLQAVLASTANQQRQSNQLLPLMSVSNIVAHQQVNAIESSTPISNSQASSSQTSGLAASSPTLAALLDAGSSRNTDLINNNSNFSSQNFVSTNLLRKLVSGNTTELKRGELTLHQGSALSLSNGGSSVTVCGTNTNTSSSYNQSKSCKSNGTSSSEKRIKLENLDMGSVQTTFTLIDPQSLVVTNSNDKTSKQTFQTSSANLTSNSQQQNKQQQQNLPKSNAEVTKQVKNGSSTGNRQVDPTQPFRCEHCNSTFTRLGNFTRHKKIHTVPTKDGQRFKCDVCSKSFLQRCDLARHLHIHRGTEPHRCNICGKGYIRHSDLVTHQRFHNKEKPFGCPHCSKGFCQRGDLNRHLRSIHLQMKPILCPCCNRKFAKQETLLRHLNTTHRSKAGTNTGNAVITGLHPNYSVSQSGDKQNAVSVVANVGLNESVSNNSNTVLKIAPVSSLQAIQATMSKAPNSVDPSNTSASSLNSE